MLNAEQQDEIRSELEALTPAIKDIAQNYKKVGVTSTD